MTSTGQTGVSPSPVTGSPRRAHPPRPAGLARIPARHWPNTANRHVLISRISALGTRPVSPDYLDKHHLRGISSNTSGATASCRKPWPSAPTRFTSLWSSTSTTPARWPTPTPPATFSAARPGRRWDGRRHDHEAAVRARTPSRQPVCQLLRAWICGWVSTDLKIINSSSSPVNGCVPSIPSHLLTPARMGAWLVTLIVVGLVPVASSWPST
jgi:hypothetical protein